MLRFSDLVIATDKRPLFSVDQMQLETGIVALVGRNGAGKSTLFKSIIGSHPFFKGKIEINGRDIQTIRREELAKHVAIVFSKASVFGHHSGRDLVYLGRLPYQNLFSMRTELDHKIVNEIIDLLGLSEFVDQAYARMSDGEKQLIMIGRAMAQDTPIIVLDEPNAFLDLVNRYKVMDVLRKIGEKAQKLVLFSTHEINFLPDLCQSVLLIDKEKLVKIDDPDQFIPTIRASFGLVD